MEQFEGQYTSSYAMVAFQQQFSNRETLQAEKNTNLT